jgi:hypothetical protein
MGRKERERESISHIDMILGFRLKKQIPTLAKDMAYGSLIRHLLSLQGVGGP